MSSTNQTEDDFAYSGKGAWVDFLATFGGVLLIISASFEVLQGAAAIANPEFFSSGDEYLYRFSVETWGWIHLVLGLVGVATGIGLLASQSWAYLVGIVIAFFGALSSFAFLPYYPFWAMTIIAFDVFVIWALTVTIASDRP